MDLTQNVLQIKREHFSVNIRKQKIEQQLKVNREVDSNEQFP